MKRRSESETCHVQPLERRFLLCTVHADHLTADNLVYSSAADGWIRQGDVGSAWPIVVDSQTPAPIDRSNWIGDASSAPLALNATANAAPTPYTTGAKDILLIRVRFSDQAATYEPQSMTSAQNMLSQLDTFFRTNSFGALSLDLAPDASDPQASTVTSVYVLPGTRADYTTWGDGRVMTDARLVARNPQNYAGNEGKVAYDYVLFDQYAVRFGEGPGGYLGQAYVGAKGTWLKSSSAGVAAHEFGHNLGLWHANYWDPSNDISAIGDGGDVEYGDPYDTMNSSARGSAYAYTAYHKDRLGWLDGQRTHVTTSGVYRVSAHDLGGSLQSGANYALTFAKDSTKTYWIGMRQSIADASLTNAVELHWFDTAQSSVGSQFIDTLPLTSARGDGTIQIGRTFTDPLAGIHITPIAKGTSGTLPWMDVQISFDTPAGNQPAAVTLSASALSVGTGQSISFTANATDPEGDALAYYWDFGDRTFGTTNAASVSKSFTAAGEYRVRVVVSDQHGGETAHSVLVRVSNAITNKYSGRVTDARGNPVGGVLINNGLAISEADYRWTYTDSDGRYILAGVPAGNFTLNAFSADHTLSPSGFVNPVPAGADVQAINFTASLSRYLLKGRVYNVAGTGVSGVMVSDGTRSELTDSNGYFNFFNTPSGHYTLTATKIGYTFAPISTSVEYAANTSVSINEAFGYVTGYIHGITSTTNLTVSNGYFNATVSMVGQGVSARGYYNLKAPVGTWAMRVTRAGSSFSPTGFTNPVSVVEGSTVSRDFTLDSVTTFAATGTVTHRGLLLEGATVTAISNGVTRQAVTDSRGGYHITGLTNGVWAVSPALSGYTFTPASRNVTVNNAAVTVTSFATTVSNPSPTVAVAAQVEVLSASTARLTALGADDGGEAYLTYTWSMVSGPAGAAVTYSANGLSGTDDVVATFNRAGTYTMRVTIKDLPGATVTSNVTFTIAPIASTAAISSRWSTVPYGATQAFVATLLDQFGQPMPTQPTFTWQANGGLITAAGMYTASDYGTYTVSASGGGFAASIPVVTTYPIGPGSGILQEVWTGISGNGVSSLTTVITAGTAPNSTSLMDSFELTGTLGTSYGERLRGLFVAPVTGSYTFWIAADDTGELYLSTTDSPLNKQLIASVTSSTTSRQWDKSTSQKSAVIQLVAGERYYIEALHKQGGSSDNLAVRVQMPGNVIEETIAGHRLIPWSDNPAPTVVSPAQASPAVVTGSTTTLSVLGADDGGEAALTYTWSIESKPLGAADPSFSVNGTNASKNAVATFSSPGNYAFKVTIADAFGGTVTSTVAVTVSSPAVLRSVVSRKTHGAAGTFDVNLLSQTGIAIESRAGGASKAYEIVFGFDRELASGQAVLLAGTAVISGVTESGSNLVVSLTGVADVQRLRLGVQNVVAPGASVLPSADVYIVFLIGDSTGDGSVANGDVSQVRSRVAVPVTAANFRSDINADGSIANGDVSQARSKVGNTMPLAAPDDDELTRFAFVQQDLLQELR